MISQPDRPWCPSCSTDRRSYELEDGACRECETDVDEEWPLGARVRRRVRQVVGLNMLAAIALAPLWLAAWRFLTTDTPLYATRTVVKVETVHYGIIPDLMGFLGLWVVLLLLVAIASPIAPRRFH